MADGTDEDYCMARGRHGWLCLLRSGHDGPHYSVDNRRKHNGTPGKPVRWPQEGAGERAGVQLGVGVAQVVKRPQPPVSAQEQRPGYTGILCDACGSPNTVRIGKCLRCDDCQTAGECG